MKARQAKKIGQQYWEAWRLCRDGRPFRRPQCKYRTLLAVLESTNAVEPDYRKGTRHKW